MKLRAITIGVPGDALGLAATWVDAGEFLRTASHRFQDLGVDVQTRRLSTLAWPDATANLGHDMLMERALDCDHRAADEDIGYVALGPVPLGDGEIDNARPVAEAIAATERSFLTIKTARPDGVLTEACMVAATVVRHLAVLTPGGFGNLRFAAIANCPPGIPFFPAAYHTAGHRAFGLALEGADLALAACSDIGPDGDVAGRLARMVESAVLPLERVALQLQDTYGIAYLGADLSPAPFPSDTCSVAAAMEAASGSPFGSVGTLAIAATITRALRRARVRRCGFSGLMLPIPEDRVLARRSTESRFSIHEILLYSAVCGTGLDTVPIPGDASHSDVAALVRDVSALSVALKKPLTARLFPVPGKKAGDHTAYDFPYFVNGSVLPLAR
ncbi:MAG: hypothetical protein NVSMB52_16220 [Chloroflexota bacterium]